MKIKSVKVSLASPSDILDLSKGEILKPETINYRTGRSEKDGLFDEVVFGPSRNYQCYCGKYNGVRFKGVVCDRCGVEVTHSSVRRYRFGHIKLNAPVAHIWFLKNVPSQLSLVLGVSAEKLENVIYYAGYIITKVDEVERNKILKELNAEYKKKMSTLKDPEEIETLKQRFILTKKELLSIEKFKVISEAQYGSLKMRFPSVFEAGIGGEVIYDILKQIDVVEELKNLEAEYENATTEAARSKLQKRIAFFRKLLRSGNRPEHMFITVLPVLPCALRPLITLEGTGLYASSDLNDLYRKVIVRNNRLKKLISINAPDVILRNEKRMLQEAVDALLDNSISTFSGNSAMNRSNRRALKSIADNLKGKQGLLRRNLLGKRVDYSGRSVITIGPDLKIDECGLPKDMALELFKPFVISKLIEREVAFNVRGANRVIDRREDVVWEVLEEVVEGKYVLLNRAPTLHKLSIQAFKPKLIEEKVIQIHPLVCKAFNADFDGDQMAVHLPLFQSAQEEAKYLMSSRVNLIVPKTGGVSTSPSQDLILGCYWLTGLDKGEEDRKKEDLKVFLNKEDLLFAYDNGGVRMRERVLVYHAGVEKYADVADENGLMDTTVGRIVFNDLLPDDFEYVNKQLKGGDLKKLSAKIVYKYGVLKASEILDDIKKAGFKYSMVSGTTTGYTDFEVPEGKKKIIEEAEKKEKEVIKYYNEGLVSDEEKYYKIIEIWENASAKMKDLLQETLLKESESTAGMIVSRARGDIGQLNQSSGIKGLIRNVSGKLLEYAVKSSYFEGLGTLEYFFNTTTARKGLVDKALRTADAGYLSRKLHEVAHDVVVVNDDCGTKEYISVSREDLGDEVFSNEIYGRILAEDVVDGKDVVAKKGDLIDRGVLNKLMDSGVNEVKIRSVLRCANPRGVCANCYGMDMSTNRKVKIGVAVGTIAAQSIGEPGTQLTMNVIHLGGASGTDITSGLPRVVELFELRKPKSPAIMIKYDGVVDSVAKLEKKGFLVVNVMSKLKDEKGNVVDEKIVSYTIPPTRKLNDDIKEGKVVKVADVITDGAIDMVELFELTKDRDVVEKTIKRLIREVYEANGVTLNSKHFDLILMKMLSRWMIEDPGDSVFTTGEIVEYAKLIEENERVKSEGGKESKARRVFLGITNTVLTGDSWMAAASFQYTPRVLVGAVVEGKTDHLRGLKENVIVGNHIPAGTGYRDDYIDEAKKELGIEG